MTTPFVEQMVAEALAGPQERPDDELIKVTLKSGEVIYLARDSGGELIVDRALASTTMWEKAARLHAEGLVEFPEPHSVEDIQKSKRVLLHIKQEPYPGGWLNIRYIFPWRLDEKDRPHSDCQYYGSRQIDSVVTIRRRDVSK